MTRLPLVLVALAAVLLPASRALAWGALGHKVTALIAYRQLTPSARLRRAGVRMAAVLNDVLR